MKHLESTNEDNENGNGLKLLEDLVEAEGEHMESATSSAELCCARPSFTTPTNLSRSFPISFVRLNPRNFTESLVRNPLTSIWPSDDHHDPSIKRSKAQSFGVVGFLR